MTSDPYLVVLIIPNAFSKRFQNYGEKAMFIFHHNGKLSQVHVEKNIMKIDFYM